MADEQADQTRQKELDQKGRAAAAVPAVYIDAWLLTTWPGHIRITFGENMRGTATYRNAVVMQSKDAERICKHILRVIEKQKDRDAAPGNSEAVESPKES